MKYTERIRSLREDSDFNQSQIAEILNVCQKTYSDYELGKTRIPIESIIKLAKHYNVSVDYICGVTDIKKFSLKIKVPFKTALFHFIILQFL